MADVRRWFGENGIREVHHVPCDDSRMSTYVPNLYQAAQKLYQLQDQQKHKVYVHCTTGVSRSVTLVIVYLALYMKHKDWADVQLLKEFVESEYNNRNEPNLMAAQRVIDENRQFQEKQVNKLQEDKDKIEKMRLDWERKKQMFILQNEAEMIRLSRIVEEEEEKLRVQRVTNEEQEKLRQEKIREEQILMQK